MITLYRIPGLGAGAADRIRRVSGFAGPIETEYCLYIGTSTPLNQREFGLLRRYLATSYLPEGIGDRSHLAACKTVLEVGPRMAFETVASSTTVSMFHDCGLAKVDRIERSIRIGLPIGLTREEGDKFLKPLFQRMFFDRMTQERYYQPLESFDGGRQPEPVVWIPVAEGGMAALREAGKRMGLALDDQDYDHFFSQFHDRLHYDPSDACMLFGANECSEHCSHAGVFGAQRYIDGVPCEQTLMEEARAAYVANPGRAWPAGDEASIFRGLRPVLTLVPEKPGGPSEYVPQMVMFHPAISDESHCHPSKVCPFWGSATGVARVRDNTAAGRGGTMGCAWFGIAVDNLCIPDYLQQWEDPGWRSVGAVSPLEIAIEGRDGGWYFGNALGEPVLGGFFISLGLDPGDGPRGYRKPIIFTGGKSQIREEHVEKHQPEPGMELILIGGPLDNVGYGGGTRSSTSASVGDDLELAEEFDFNSVQRGAPEMQNRAIRVIRALTEMGLETPVETLGDCGAGGILTKAAELAKRLLAGVVDYLGLWLDFRAAPCSDRTMSPSQLLNAESQEKHILVCRPENRERILAVADRFSCPAAVIGKFTGDGRLVCYDSQTDTNVIDMPMDVVFGSRPQKRWDIKRVTPIRHPLRLPRGLTAKRAADLVLRHPTVASKKWLTDHVDRSVGGRTVQQSCVGPWQLPVADYWVHAENALDIVGTATAQGVQPLAGLNSPAAMARLIVTEALLGLSCALVSGLEDLTCEVNWFADAKAEGEGVGMDETARALTKAEIDARIRQAGGKDSVSGHNLAINPEGVMVDVKWPLTVVVTAAVQMPDMRIKVTPLLEEDTLIHVDFCPESKPLGSSILAQVHRQVGNDCPDFDFGRVISYFHAEQEILREGLIASLHDISDGGLFTTIAEMAFCSGVGLEIETSGKFGWLKHYFSQVPGAVIGCKAKDAAKICRRFQKVGVAAEVVGKVRKSKTKPMIGLSHNGRRVLNEPMLELRAAWLETSFRLDAIKTKPECVAEEREALATLLAQPPYRLTYASPRSPQLGRKEIRFADRPGAAIVWAPGSNGDDELRNMAFVGGFRPFDIDVKDLAQGKVGMDHCQLQLDAGGFSYLDEPFEAGVAWAATVEENERAREQDRAFRAREDTLIYSPCNAAQKDLLLGVTPFPELTREKRPRFLTNESGVFESRFVTVEILPSPAVMFRDMEGSRLGIIVAHREGRLYCHDPAVLERILADGLAPMRYIGPDGELATTYPFLPNGSPHAIAGLCTQDGRFVVTMPHIERLFLDWQWPWMPRSWRRRGISPWLKCMENMYEWCLEHRS